MPEEPTDAFLLDEKRAIACLVSIAIAGIVGMLLPPSTVILFALYSATLITFSLLALLFLRRGRRERVYMGQNLDFLERFHMFKKDSNRSYTILILAMALSCSWVFAVGRISSLPSSTVLPALFLVIISGVLIVLVAPVQKQERAPVKNR